MTERELSHAEVAKMGFLPRTRWRDHISDQMACLHILFE